MPLNCAAIIYPKYAFFSLSKLNLTLANENFSGIHENGLETDENTPNSRLYGKAPPKRVAFLSSQYTERVEKVFILTCERVQNSLQSGRNGD